MANRTVRVVMSADVSGYTSSMDRAAKATDKTAAAAEKAAKAAERAAAQQGAAASKLSGSAQQQTRAVQSSAMSHEQALGRIGSSFAKLGVGGALAFAGMEKTVMGFDAQMSQVKASSPEAAASIDKLRAAAIQAGAEFGQFNATEAAQGITELSKAGLSTADILGGGLTGALSLAAAGQMDVGAAAETSARALNMFQLKGADAGHVADVLAAAAGKAVGDVSDFGQGLSQTGLVAHQYGVSLEETTGTLAAFAQAGLQGSDAGTSMKQMLLQLASPSKESAATMKALGINAYDASGRFIGMAGLAGQLQDKLGGLSQAQQTAALKTIFGADAIRAANVLMTQGKAGIQGWTSAVNAQGFAAEQAAAKTDNLQGDLKNLGGAWETLTIKMMSGGQSPLRGFVQSATSAVDWMNKLSPSAQGAALRVAAVGTGSALAVGGIIKLTSATRGALETLSSLGGGTRNNGLSKVGADGEKAAAGLGKTKGAAGGLGGVIGKLGAGLAGAAAGFAVVNAAGTIANEVFGRNASSAELLATQMAGLSKGGGALDAFNKSISQSVRPGLLEPLKDQVKDVDSLFANMKVWDNKVDNIGSSISGLVGWDDKLADMRKEFGSIDTALSSMSAKDAGVAFTKLRAAADKAGYPVEKLNALLPNYAAKVQVAAGANGKYASSASQLADMMGGHIPDAIKSAQAKTAELQKTLTTMPASTNVAINVKTEGGKATVDQFMASIKGLTKPQLATIKTIAETKGLDKAAAAVKALGGKTTKTTLQVLADTRKLAQAKAELVSLDGKLHVVKVDVNTATGQLAIANFKAQLTGLSKPQKAQVKAVADTGDLVKAADMVKRFGGTVAVARVDVNAVAAKAQLDAFMGNIKGITSKPALATIKTIAETGDLKAAEAAVKKFGGTVSTAKVKTAVEDAKLKALQNNLAYAAGHPSLVTVDVNTAEGKTRLDQFMVTVNKVKDTKARAEITAVANTGQLGKAGEMLDAWNNRKATATATIKGNTAGAKLVAGALASLKPKTVPVSTKGNTTGAKLVAGAIASIRPRTVPVNTKGNPSGARLVAGAVAAVSGKTVTVSANGNASGAYEVRDAIANVHDKTVYVTTVTRAIVMGGLAAAAGGGAGMADGGIMEFYARGGVRESHVAQIAPAGTWRVWAEDETGGEAYIPLHPAKRARSLDILEQVAARFGRKVEPFAQGGVVSSRAPGYAAALAGVSATSSLWLTLTKAITDLTSATKSSAAAQKAGLKQRQAYVSTAATVKQIQATKNRVATSQKDQLALYDQAILNAQRAKKPSEVKRLQTARKQSVINEQKQQLALSRQLTAAQAKAAAAAKAVQPYLNAQAKATERLAAAQQAQKEAQQALTESARSYSDTFAGRYGLGGSLADSVSWWKEGTKDLTAFTTQLQKLRSLGLDESIVQQIAAQGPNSAGSDLAAEVARGGAKSVQQLNAAAKALQDAADKLGMVQAVGIKRASGGAVFGAGTSTSDSIPTNLSDGEFVIRTRAAQRIGYGNLAQMNRTGLPTYAMPSAATGIDGSAVAQAVAQGLAGATLQVRIDGMTGLVDARIERAEASQDMALRTRGYR